MAIQEEIREGIARKQAKFDDWDWDTQLSKVDKGMYLRYADKLLSYLHSQGVVVKVKCPDCEWSQFVGGESVGMTPCHTCNSTGYIYEPLITEVIKEG